jgi:hypothetical protein
LQQDLNSLSEKNTISYQEKHQVQQNLAEKDQIIKQLERELINEQNKRIVAERNSLTERQNNQSLREIIANLKQKLHTYEQNHTNLINTYQIALKDKERAEKSAQAEKQNVLIQKQRADNYENQLKFIVQTLHQWQKT